MRTCRVLGVQVAQENRRNILADLLTVYANAGKTIVFTQTKREADEVAAGIAGVIPSEVTSLWLSQTLISTNEMSFKSAGRCYMNQQFNHTLPNYFFLQRCWNQLQLSFAQLRCLPGSDFLAGLLCRLAFIHCAFSGA